MTVALNPGEETQLLQTIEMFEVITESQPLDSQSLEILKEAYAKLGWEKDAVRTAKRIASANVQLGQLSSAILEYESILQRYPEDNEAQRALAELEMRANQFSNDSKNTGILDPSGAAQSASLSLDVPELSELDDGRKTMERIFVDGKHLSSPDFSLFWPTPDFSASPKQVADPFVHLLAEKQLVPLDVSLRLLSEHSRLAYLPLEKYDVDVDLARSLPRKPCLRWCILPFDRLSHAILVATANPFNKEAERELAKAISSRIIWYLASPVELLKIIRKVYR